MKTWRSIGWQCYKMNQTQDQTCSATAGRLLLREGLGKTLFYPFHGNVSFEGLLAERKGRAVGLFQIIFPCFYMH